MNGRGGDSWHDDELARLGTALGYDTAREPPADRVAALRAAAEQLQATRGGVTQGGSAPPGPGTSGGSGPGAVVTPMPRRRQFLLGAIAASAGAVAGFGAKAAFEKDNPAGPPTEQIAFVAAAGEVSSAARLIDHTWGTELMLEVSGLAGGQVYGVTYLDATALPIVAGSFLGVADTLMKCRFNAAALRADLRAISITDPTGVEVLRAELG